MADLYAQLNVARGASEAEIKKAYRKLAKELHPDKNKDNPKATERFSKVTQAYDILTDKDKRAQYDRGEIDEEGNPRMPFGYGGGPGAGAGRGGGAAAFAGRMASRSNFRAAARRRTFRTCSRACSGAGGGAAAAGRSAASAGARRRHRRAPTSPIGWTSRSRMRRGSAASG